MNSKGHGKPPEGVLVGESVPAENDQVEMEDAKIDELAAELRTKPGYRDLSESEAREKVKEKLL